MALNETQQTLHQKFINSDLKKYLNLYELKMHLKKKKEKKALQTNE